MENKDLMIIRLGIGFNEEDEEHIKNCSDSMEKKLGEQFTVIIITGENEDLETKFEIIKV